MTARVRAGGARGCNASHDDEGMAVDQFRIETRRLALREFRAGDEADLVDLHRDPRVCEYLVDDPVRTEDEARRVIRWLVGRVYPDSPGFGIWHASLRDSGAFAGFFSLTRVPGSDDVELGARLHPRVWGRRLALEGAEALVAHAFGSLRLERLVGIAHPLNRPVRFFLECLGFERLSADADAGAVRYGLGRARWQERAARRADGARLGRGRSIRGSGEAGLGKAPMARAGG
jgi:RimJ/RimL family protein N-acetyltransferase